MELQHNRTTTSFGTVSFGQRVGENPDARRMIG
jgi:hypothetical protein